jgi:chemotaxis protein histidine kinase CheA
MTVVAFKVKGTYALVEPHMKYMYKGCSFLESLARFETPLEEVKDENGRTKWVRNEEKYVKIVMDQQKILKEKWNLVVEQLQQMQDIKKQEEEEQEKQNKILEKKQKMEKKQSMKKKQKQLLKEKEMQEEEEINKAILESKSQKIDSFDILGEFSNITNFKGEKFIFIEGQVPILDKDNNYFNVFFFK